MASRGKVMVKLAQQYKSAQTTNKVPIIESQSSDTDFSTDSVVNPSYKPNYSDEDSTSMSAIDVEIDIAIEQNDSTIITNKNKSPVKLSPSLKKGKKRKRNVEDWKKNKSKKLRNLGKSYESTNKTMKPEKQMKSPCKQSCKLKCISNITEEERQLIFSNYWNLGDIEKQRSYISNSMKAIVPKYRYIRVGGIRQKRIQNNAFYFNFEDRNVRVCKVFFKKTLAINDRPIRTVLEKQNKIANAVMEEDQRGKHGNHSKLDESIKNSIRQFIDSIPKIESHYLRSQTSKMFIDGSKSIAELHRDYVADCKIKNNLFGNYTLFYRIFTEEFNISFFTPKKDQCEVCTAYTNAEEKENLHENYELHLNEKNLSRLEKESDKSKSDNTIVAVYDLQAVFQCPKGDVSTFYYLSKLNVLDFTIYNLKTHIADCFVWDESCGGRGINELGSCVFQFLQNINEGGKEVDVIFYSDNCGGQQKNKFMIGLYLFAVKEFVNIKSITHKFLIKGHTQNEGDSVHSIIERQVKRNLKRGPMYTPEAFIAAIRCAKKTGEPFHVHEISFQDFYDWKDVCTQMGISLTVNKNNETVKILPIKMFRLEKIFPKSLFYKTSYAESCFKEAVIIKRKKDLKPVLRKAYEYKPGLSENKKTGLLSLVQKKIIPEYYRAFFDSL